MGQHTSTQRDTSASASASSSSSSCCFPLIDLLACLLPHNLLQYLGQPTSTQRDTPASASSASASAPSSASPPAPASASSASASASAFSSSSSSALTPNGPYQVFINHRGPDVKNRFASFLYRELKSRGLQVFLDKPELESGHIISPQIEGAIQSASVQIAIFSKKYAESKWCLEELVLMLETMRRDTMNQRATILPVFYEVKPCELRHTDTGAYAEAMLKHKQRSFDLETIEKWERALSDVAGISGFELEPCNGDEVELVDKIVQRVLKEVPKPPLFVANHKIGLQEKLEDFETTALSQLKGQDTLEAKVVGIVGSGGIGKSTLAKEFFNKNRSNYNGSSFLFDVRESAAKKSLNSLQKKLIKDLIGQDISIDSWEEGVGILENNLKSCEALIILDDVDHRYQLDAFLPVKSVLHPRSLILVTSRDKDVLRRVCTIQSSIYELKGLDRPNSSELFCWHAFFQPHPPSEFVDLVDGFVKACGGLPLSLQVFESLLCQVDDRSCWEEQLNGLQKLPDDIQIRLRISYDSLSREEQQIFLDIACFSIGQDKDEWIRIWGWSGWKGSMGFRNLQNKSLVEVDEYNRIRIHDHLRDMGRSIAQDPSLPRRLGGATPKDVYDLLEQSSSSVIEVRGIIMAPSWSWGTDQCNLEVESFSDKVFRISKLQLLQAEGDFVEGILTKLVRSPNLIWLCWYQCPCSSLPSCIPMSHLRFLHVEGNHLQRLWQRESQPPVQLRQLYIEAPLLELSNSIENLTNLQSISLHGCTSLEVLPNAIGTLMNLREIDLSGWANLKTLPNFSVNLSNLQKIGLRGCTSLEVLPDSIENLRNLQSINLGCCSSLEVLPNAIGTLMNLRKIDLSFCEKLKRLPNFSQNLSNLQKISLAGCESLEVLPDSIKNLRNLQSIDLGYCSSLKALPNAFWTLTNLREIDLSSCESMEDLPNSIENLSNLQNINLKDCKRLKALPNGIWTLMDHWKIDLSGFANLKRLPNFSENLSNVQNISLRDCKSLEVLPDSIENLTNLQQINLAYCESLKALPYNFGNLTNLKYIDASYASNLQMPPNFLGNLLQLTHLHLSCCSRLILSNETLGNTTTLECLDLSGCLRIEVLPLQVLQQRSLKRLNLLRTNIRELPSAPTVCLNNLEVLILGSPLLKVLPPWLGCLKNLKILLLHGCRKLKCLPVSIGQCSQMREMEISKCGIQYLPPAIMQLNNLITLRVRGCPLRELPFKKNVEGGGEPSVKLTESSSQGRELDSSSDRGMNGLCEMHLYLTQISEVSFPAGVCPNLRELKIRWCNDLVEVGALPAALESLDLRGCGALREVGGLCGLEELERLDIRGCCSLEVEELAGVETVLSMDTLRPILTSLKILKTPLETDNPEEAQMTEAEAEAEVQWTADLDHGVLRDDLLCRQKYGDEDEDEDEKEDDEDEEDEDEDEDEEEEDEEDEDEDDEDEDENEDED